MKLKKTIVVGFILATIGTSNLFAGTPGIKGIYEGTYNLEIKGRDGIVKATSTKEVKWNWDFNKGIAMFKKGNINTPHGDITHKTYSPKTLIDNKDGTYTYTYKFQPITPQFAGPKASSITIFDITKQKNGELVIKTIDSNRDGIVGSITSHPQLDFVLVLPKEIELNWSGTAR
jgi:hypothetical protein